MRTKSSTNLKSEQLTSLMRLIEKTADIWLRANGYPRGLAEKPVQQRFGFDEKYSKEEGSIKTAILGNLTEQNYPLKKEFGCKADGKTIRWNGRELYQLAQHLDEKGEVPVSNRYLAAYLAFIKIESIAQLPEPDSIDPVFNLLKPVGQSRTTKALARSRWDIFDHSLRNLHNTNWYIYEYDIHAQSQDAPSIVRDRFRILEERNDKTGDIDIQLLRSKPFSNFFGRLVYNRCTPRILIFRLHTEKFLKYLEMMLHVEQTLERNLYLGICLRYDSNDSVVSNTVVLEKRGEAFEDMTSVKLENTEELCRQHGISGVISSYLKNKYQNVIRIPSGIGTLYDMARWYGRRRHEIPQMNQNITYDIYIDVFPKTRRINHDEGGRIENEIMLMQKDQLWEQMGIQYIYCPVYDVAYYRMKEPIKIIEENLQKFRQCKAYLLIIENVISEEDPLFMQLGWAMYAGKPAFIICNNPKKLPHSLQQSSVHNRIFTNTQPVEISEIPQWLYINNFYLYI